ncbi:unnamed protein product [Protopolystoma xenopodis]|uniref:Protein kinase domain-containing protein n=1 Tax=Protopolystoma xenopodis TaxID=117903 RepID=A0A448X2Q6_9PLAT|nr:unnamed protein product [Protopolystoma xenopodis]
MSRAMQCGRSYYSSQLSVELKLPVAWCAPECFPLLGIDMTDEPPSAVIASDAGDRSGCNGSIPTDDENNPGRSHKTTRSRANEVDSMTETDITHGLNEAFSDEEAGFTSCSDVWAYGVTLWELLTYGFVPYAGLTGRQIARGVIGLSETTPGQPARSNSALRLHQPDQCPDAIYDALMRPCWAIAPQARPSFAQITGA